MKNLAGSFVLCCSILAIGQQPEYAFSSRQLYAAATLAYSARSGYIDFDSLQKSVAVSKPDMLALGLTAGFRFPLTRLLRAQLGLAFDAGAATDDTLYTARPSIDNYYYYRISFEPSLQCALAPRQWRAVPFAVLGAGVNAVYVDERTFFANDPGQEVIYTDRYYVKQWSWSVSASAGLGLDVRLTRRVGITFVSTFRWLYPVSWDVQEDFPLYALHYTETLYGDVTWLGVTFRL
ncbi:MAG TPA: hypothetical protein VKF42_00890 [Chitinivibrionales bacterium]|nr:hypothetical protein [Chitinivibrionales bacterium]